MWERRDGTRVEEGGWGAGPIHAGSASHGDGVEVIVQDVIRVRGCLHKGGGAAA